MRNTHSLTHSLAILVPIMAVLAHNSIVFGFQTPPPPQFRIIELPVLVNPNGTDTATAYGINNKGEICGQSGTSTEQHAFIWLPAPAYGLSAGMHDLHVMAGNPGNVSIAKDINMNGEIVGQVGTKAAYWKLKQNAQGQPMITFFDLDPIPGISDNNTSTNIAEALNDAAPNPFITGWRSDGNVAGNGILRAWRFEFGQPTAEVLVIGALDDSSQAFDINNQAAAIGFSGSLNSANLCIPFQDSARWPLNAAVMELISPFNEANRGVEARGTNDLEQAVGSGYNDTNACVINAVFFGGGTPGEKNLGELFDITQITIAEAINVPPAGPFWVVGRNVDTSSVILWTYDSAGWMGFDLNNLALTDCNSNGWTQLVEANDVNDFGWIVGKGSNNNGLERAFLLAPLPTDCAGDTNNDCVVNISDLLALLAQWNQTCSSSASSGFPVCSGDVNGDCVVNVADLLALFGSWGACTGTGCTSSAQIPNTAQKCMNMLSDPFLQCECIRGLCEAGVISAEECGNDPYCGNPQ